MACEGTSAYSEPVGSGSPSLMALGLKQSHPTLRSAKTNKLAVGMQQCKFSHGKHNDFILILHNVLFVYYSAL